MLKASNDFHSEWPQIKSSLENSWFCQAIKCLRDPAWKRRGTSGKWDQWILIALNEQWSWKGLSWPPHLASCCTYTEKNSSSSRNLAQKPSPHAGDMTCRVYRIFFKSSNLFLTARRQMMSSLLTNATSSIHSQFSWQVSLVQLVILWSCMKGVSRKK